MASKHLAPRPCESCPYRQDVPSGIWVPDEYVKLLVYDLEIGEQIERGAMSAFYCHQQDGKLCAGWVGCHGGGALGLRLFVSRLIDLEEAEYIANYETDVPLFASGREAALHGMADVLMPRADALEMIEKLERRRNRREQRV